MRVLSWVPVVLALMCLNGCALTEPYVQTGTWRPTNSADANIAAMAVRPSDLQSGIPYRPVSAVRTAAAVDRWNRDQVKALPSGGISSIAFGSNSAPTGAPAEAPAGTGAAAAAGAP